MNKSPNVRRRYVRQIRAMLHAWDRYGLPDAEQEYREKYDPRSRRPEGRPPSFARVVRGKLDFLKMVVSERASTYRTLANKLHDLDASLIAAVPEEPPPVSHEAALADQAWDYLYEDVGRLVYHLELRTSQGDIKGGTAFAWGPGALATAAHLTEGQVFVSPPLRGHVPTSDVVCHPRVEEGVDAALIRASGVRISPWLRGRAQRELPRPGQEIAVLGYPRIPQRQEALRICVGRVEGMAANYPGSVETIQFSGDLSGGFSGGPAITRGGELVGIAIEMTYDRPRPNVPRREFSQILPLRHLLEMGLQDPH